MGLLTQQQGSSMLTASIRAPFSKQYPNGPGVASNRKNANQLVTTGPRDNTYEELFLNAAGTDVIAGQGVDSADNFLLSEEVYSPMRKTITFNLATTASLVTQHFFVFPSACRITSIREMHSTAETTAATLTCYIEKLSSGTAPGSGATLQTGTFNLKATANTQQVGVLSSPSTGDSSDPLMFFVTGDRLGIKFSTTPTELAGLAITITFAPSGDELWLKYNMQANGDLVDQSIFIANRDYIVSGSVYCHSTLGTNGSAVNLQLVKDTSTDAPGAGTDLLTNNTNAGFNCKAAINVPQTGTLTATAASLRLAPGNRLSVDYAGTLTALAGVILIVVLQKVARRKEVQFTLSKNANLGVDQSFFIAGRNYQITDASEVHSVAAGGASKLQLTRDTGTDVPGAGTDLLSNNSSAGFDLAATANTVQVATWVDTRFNYLMSGDRLSLDFANAVQSTAGVSVTVSLIPA